MKFKDSTAESISCTVTPYTGVWIEIRGNRRLELQNKMDTKLDVLRTLVDTAVSPEDRLISPGLHEVWSKELNEIGRMLGGWKKSNE